MRRSVVGLALVGALLPLTGCVPPMVACTAIGYSSTLFLDLDTPTTGLTLELCDGEGCTPSPTSDFEPTETATGWVVSPLFGAGDVVGYRVTDATGAVVREGSVRPDWKRVDGSDTCGGNTEARVAL
ncbi:hypothetical protein [Microbacterium sp. Bi128]|uniref:hypothetical protein n=1 Tax=Microbacterium sp. Bi128 TaxID=2821115 RepID=UPI001DFF46D7|nr:hypothetical protein [Microbacterium sp. Bi128]CAH0178485.1 hypothetical protein SRABI128_01210 [Microbacterium sp. Bi128]